MASGDKKQAWWARTLRILTQYERALRPAGAALFVILYLSFGHSFVAGTAATATADVMNRLGAPNHSQVAPGSKPKPDGGVEKEKGSPGDRASTAPSFAMPIYVLNLAIPTGFFLLALLAIVGGPKQDKGEPAKPARGLGWVWVAGVVGISLPFLAAALIEEFAGAPTKARGDSGHILGGQTQPQCCLPTYSLR